MTVNIAELRRLEAKATPANWRYEIQYGPESEAMYAWVYTSANELVGTFKVHHAALIVAMRNALPELLDRLDDLVVENEMLRQVNSSLGHMLKPHGGVDA